MRRWVFQDCHEINYWPELGFSPWQVPHHGWVSSRKMHAVLMPLKRVAPLSLKVVGVLVAGIDDIDVTVFL